MRKMTAAQFNKVKGKKPAKRKKPKAVPFRLSRVTVSNREEFIIQLPLPAHELRGNATGPRSTWMHIKLSQEKKKARKLSKLVAGAVGVERFSWFVATYQIVWSVPNAAHFPDDDNGIRACKPYLDGLQDAGVIQNDRGLRPLPLVRRQGPEGVDIVVRPVAGVGLFA